MTRLFARFYLALVVVVALAGAVVVLSSGGDTVAAWRLLDRAPEVASRLARATDPGARDEARVALQRELGVPVRIEPVARAMDRLEGPDAARMGHGEAVIAPWAHDVQVLLVPIPDQPLVAVVAPSSWARWQPPMVVGVLVVGLGLAVLVTLRPLQGQLEHLSRAARGFGRGDFDARAPVRGSDPVSQLALTFNDMAARVQRLVAGREELLLGVAHELRHPVARLRFAVELLAEVDDPGLRRARAAELQGDLEELDALVGELLDYSRLEDGRRAPRIESLDLCAELTSLVDEARRRGPDVQVELSCEVGVLMADRALLRRAVGNLLANGVRHGRVRVSAAAGPRGARITVDDDGGGVDEADRERIFEPFHRLDPARSRDGGGVGLGLALARRIARAHGGELWVEGSPQGGARFVLDLPAPPCRRAD